MDVPEAVDAVDVAADVPGDTAPALRAVRIAAGGLHTCAILSDDTVRCWGNNEAAQLGDRTMTTRTRPVIAAGVTGAVEIAGGGGHTCVVLGTTSANVRCWGSDLRGQIGDWASVRVQPEPTAPRGPNGVPFTTALHGLVAGGSHTLGRDDIGQIWGWGSDESAQLRPPGGIGVVFDAPEQLFGARLYAAGAAFTCFDVDTASRRGVSCIGGASSGYVPASLTVPNSVRIEQLSAGGRRACVRQSDGGVQCSSGSLWVQIPAFVDALSVGVGHGGIPCAVMPDTSLRCDGATPPAITGVRDVVGGTDHFCVLLSSGEVDCWGDNASGQLGDGTVTPRATPAPVLW